MSDSYATKAVQEQVVSVEEHIDTAAPKTPANSRLGILLALFALYLLWGGTYLGMRIALQSFPPFILAGVRFLIAGSILYVFLRTRGAPSPTRAQWAGSALVGILLLVGGNGGVAFAEQWVASG
jgi:drug/metabolite transporter (DMT)-like permease